jgi:alpha-beta hydrolase superfamily lysophospholipase
MKLTKLIYFYLFIITFNSYSQNTEIGKSFINAFLIEKNTQKAYTFFDDNIKSKISELQLKETLEKLETQIGQFKSIIETNNEKETYFYYSDFEKMKLDIKISLNDNKKIIGFFFVPHKDFQKENSFGKDLNIKSNNIELKGTLLVPEKENLKKLIIFVHGSGPNDRDESVSENKPFKNIAENLYAKGISTYRFDKRTLSNPESFNDKSSIDDEVTNDILNIVSYFKNNTEFADYQIIVLGHSLGANLLPRIANKSNNISKIILLAGNSRPLSTLITEQYDYLYKLTPSEELKEASQKIKEQIKVLNSKSFNLNTQKEKLPFNLSAYYWKSVLDYNPTKEIKKVKIPILILQGERDYQVTMKDFEIWKTSLKNNKNATFISYPKLNHLFITGDNPSNPKEYEIKGKVDEKVINDIVKFIIQ